MKAHERGVESRASYLETPTSPVPPTNIAVTSYAEPDWHDLCVSPEELRVTATIATGQCFNWRPVKFRVAQHGMARSGHVGAMECADVGSGATAGDIAWVGVLGKRVVAVRDTPTTTLFACLADGNCYVGGEVRGSGDQRGEIEGKTADFTSVSELRRDLRDYFQLPWCLTKLYTSWSAHDERLRTIAQCLPGLRVLRQDPVECLFSFVISSNNNISRIILILNRLRATYGTHLLTLPAASSNASGASPPRASSSSSSSSLSVAETLFDSDDDAEAEEAVDRTPKKAAKTTKSAAAVRSATASSATKQTQTAGAASGDQHFYSFPPLGALALASEEELRALGLGYRARFVRETAAALLARGRAAAFDGDEAAGRATGAAATGAAAEAIDDTAVAAVEAASHAWLTGLRSPDLTRGAVAQELLAFTGVGQKVADCVALFSLDRRDVVPVDTHVWQIACRDYEPTLREAKSLTPAVYERVGDLFRTRFGAEAGWAHSLLFAAELPAFKALLPVAMQREMDEFAKLEKRRKAQRKEEAQAERDRKRKKAAEDSTENAASK